MNQELRKPLEEMLFERCHEALGITIENIIGELPNGKQSPIASQIHLERTGPGEWVITSDTPVWSYLNDGTGIYNPYMHGGAGPGGAIVPVNATLTGMPVQTLHFKNAKLAAALGFPDENVFLRSVKGIRPRYYFERHIEGPRFAEVLANV